jgi:hypothetical protein
MLVWAGLALAFLPAALVVSVVGAAIIEWFAEKGFQLFSWICDHVVARNLSRPLRGRRRW